MKNYLTSALLFLKSANEHRSTENLVMAREYRKGSLSTSRELDYREDIA